MVCVILAGGRGKRMASQTLHKVCFPIAGRPAILRSLDAYKAAGFREFLIVVGPMAEQIMATVAAEHPEAMFVHQPESRGTGHAAQVAAAALAARGFEGDVAVVMGDKVAQPAVVHRMAKAFLKGKADALVTTLPLTGESSAGRVVLSPQGQVLGIVELRDLLEAQAKHRPITIGGQRFTPDQIERQSPVVNASMYCFRFPMLYAALAGLKSDNAQGELYLTDTIAAIAQQGRVLTFHVADPTQLMAFNTPAELLAIEETLRRREKPPRVSVPKGARPLPREALRPVAEWQSVLGNRACTRAALRLIYGSDPDLLDERRSAWLGLLRSFAEWQGPARPVLLCRAPGRINLMGRHVDHRGGYVNVMAIHREVLVAAAPREDDVVRLRNVETERFPPREFRISDLVRDFSWADWMDFLASRTVHNVLHAAPGDWSHYARAPLLRLQHESPRAPLKGMDCLVSGNIPPGAGLSSSSALVVAFAEAAIALNRVNVALHDFVDLCGEGEWFVGSRGGAADHAAIRTSRIGSVSRIGFFPFRLEGEVPLPPGLQVVIGYSGAGAHKSGSARDVFNQRIACYEIGFELLRRNWPAAAGAAHLRDLIPERLGVSPADLYVALTALPEAPRRPALRSAWGRMEPERLRRLFATHKDSGAYDLRGVLLFGLSECARSEHFAALLRDGDLERIGLFMRASHDGDRVCRTRPGARSCHFHPSLDTRALTAMARHQEPIENQSGRYACSTEIIDALVDSANSVPGVIGAQLAGAGLGGCMMVLVRNEAVSELTKRLCREVYEPRGIPPEMHVCRPVNGAGLLLIP